MRRTSCSTLPPWTSSLSTWPAASPGARAPASLFSSPWPPLPAGPQLDAITPPNPGRRGVAAALDRARCTVRRAIPGRGSKEHFDSMGLARAAASWWCSTAAPCSRASTYSGANCSCRQARPLPGRRRQGIVL
jgi:hypothetical protein